MKSIWTVELEERWSYEKKFDDDSVTGEYRVVASSYEVAVEKATKAALKKSFFDDENETTESVVEVRIVAVNRGEKIDA